MSYCLHKQEKALLEELGSDDARMEGGTTQTKNLKILLTDIPNLY